MSRRPLEGSPRAAALNVSTAASRRVIACRGARDGVPPGAVASARPLSFYRACQGGPRIGPTVLEGTSVSTGGVRDTR